MKSLKYGIALLMLLAALATKAQINLQDSSVQVISYWNLGEEYEYAVSLQTLKYTGDDTISNETITYDVNISVIDSTQDSYTIRWYYKNFKSNSENPLSGRLAAISEDIAVDIKTDELGVIQSVENWKEVRDYMMRSLDTVISSSDKTHKITKVFQKMKEIYSTKASIEAAAIKDVQQFHNFHGARFVLNETVTEVVKTPNLYNSKNPFDMGVSVTLEDIDAANSQYIIRSIHEINSEQLTEATFNYLKEMANFGGEEFMKKEEFMNLTNTTEVASRIHNRGWVLESMLWKEVTAGESTNKEIRRIQIK